MRLKKDIIGYLYIVFSFYLIDLWLRFVTKSIGMYSIKEIPPNLFSLLWSLIISSIIFSVFKNKAGRLIYIILYCIFSIYAVVQYGYYLIFGKFLFLSDFLFAGEGSEYISYVLDILNVKVIFQIILLFGFGILGAFVYPKKNEIACKMKGVAFAVVITAFVGILLTPNFYYYMFFTSEKNYRSPSFEYSRFVNSAYDVQLTGIYQYVARDLYLNVNKRIAGNTVEAEARNEIKSYFDKKNEISKNDMSGIFSGKNVIVVMMESIDDWLVTEEDMPTVYYMMQNGISFENMYTPNYSSGYTINTEFAFNTSIYPLSTENFIYTLVENNFDNSIANAFKNKGYTVNSYHHNLPEYYNRGNLHAALGYEEYYSYFDYETEGDVWAKIHDDRFLYLKDSLYEELIRKNENEEVPFMSFVITMSGHLPYYPEDWFGIDAFEIHPEYAEGGITDEKVLRVKARITDDMFKGLLQRLEEDRMLEDTVIVGFADHYVYGFTDKELLQQRSEEAGNAILENTPAFIYCAGMEESITVDKVCQITDLAPTIENLFGLEVAKETMGNDIFDDSYEGYAIFPNNTWITNEVYMKDGELIYNYGMSETDIIRMNEFVQWTYMVNDYLLEYDYFNKEE